MVRDRDRLDAKRVSPAVHRCALPVPSRLAPFERRTLPVPRRPDSICGHSPLRARVDEQADETEADDEPRAHARDGACDPGRDFRRHGLRPSDAGPRQAEIEVAGEPEGLIVREGRVEKADQFGQQSPCLRPVIGAVAIKETSVRRAEGRTWVRSVRPDVGVRWQRGRAVTR